MKRLFVLTTMAALLIAALAIGAFAADQPLAQVRIVNLSAITGMTYNDAGLMTLANLDVSKNTNIFPLVSDFSIITAGKEYKPNTEIPCLVTCPINISSTIKENEKLEFTSVQDLSTSTEQPVKEFNIAVVKNDGSVKRLNEPADVDYTSKTFKTSTEIPLAEGDTILVFVKEVPKSYFDYQGLQGEQGFVPY